MGTRASFTQTEKDLHRIFQEETGERVKITDRITLTHI